MFTKYGYSAMGVVFVIAFILIAISIYLDNNFVRIPLLLLSAFLLPEEFLAPELKLLF